ncbi:helix-turn-helix transcriptional regulator [Saccharothrix sp. 6-C]|uniref:helix-turn-helix domain-containing protein n=1 Tax=Saccharothrix sp. 6-C TaxID=2781735 RepID=UPI001AF643A4|nr:helix-turn-helix transcriptional regulator [Saccharothrix sp. 6-C]QQQ75480.1 helix-turn-helix transcriptional regulator [Saccharothrix sp. 6-C]
MDKGITAEEYRRFRALLRRMRLEAGLTQVDVAERLDEPQSFVSKYESGERRLDVIELRRVAEALGTTLVAAVERLVHELEHSPADAEKD